MKVCVGKHYVYPLQFPTVNIQWKLIFYRHVLIHFKLLNAFLLGKGSYTYFRI